MLIEQRHRVAIIGIIVDQVTNVLFNNLAEMLRPVCADLILLPAINLSANSSPTITGRFFRLLSSQVRLTLMISRRVREFDVVFVHSGGHWLVLPILLGKILGKRLVVFHMGGDKLVEESVNFGHSRIHRLILACGVYATLNLTYSIADLIIVQSNRLARLKLLKHQRDKLYVANGGGYVDVNHFRALTPFNKRSKIIGYIGALKSVKGVLNFVKACSLVLEMNLDSQFVVAGEGPLSSTLEAERQSLAGNLQKRLSLLGWVDHESLPDYLNRLKLLVLPSFSEGVPLVLQEAMACEVIVLATPVGGIPDLVHDGVNGFILRRNDPESIANEIEAILSRTDLSEISKRARQQIKHKFSRSIMTEKFAEVLALVNPARI